MFRRPRDKELQIGSRWSSSLDHKSLQKSPAQNHGRLLGDAAFHHPKNQGRLPEGLGITATATLDPTSLRARKITSLSLSPLIVAGLQRILAVLPPNKQTSHISSPEDSRGTTGSLQKLKHPRHAGMVLERHHHTHPPLRTSSASSSSTSPSQTPSPPNPPPVVSYAGNGVFDPERTPLLSQECPSMVVVVRPRGIIKFLETNHEPGLTTAQLTLTNDDLKPVEPARRTWGAWNFVGFWLADCVNVNTWMIASSMIVNGLNWWQAWLCVWIGYFIAACFICSTGRIGATYHIGFPVIARASFGIWGSLWPVFNRAAMACVWYGVQTWIGGKCIFLMIRACWTAFDDVPNGIAEGQGLQTNEFVAFFIFWLVSLPAIWFPVHQIRHLFTVKAYTVPVAGFAFFGWCVKRAGGVGPIVSQPSTVEGSALAWAVISGIMSSIANFATLIVNDPDFTRFAIKPRDTLWSQLITIPTGFAITSVVGIIVSSSSTVIFGGEAIWDPTELLGSFVREGGAGNRTGVFIIALALALAQLGTNIAANSVSAGTDMTALMPRFINIRRGGYVCAVVGLCMCPWRLMSSSNNFTTYLSAYSVFLSSIAGVMICDYYWVRKGYLEIKGLYSARKIDPYYFTFGVHLRAYAAYIAGILINVVGFAGAVGRKVPKGATYVYNLNFFCGFIVSAGVYYILCRVFPVPATSEVWCEVGEVSEVTLAYDASEVESEDVEAQTCKERGDGKWYMGKAV